MRENQRYQGVSRKRGATLMLFALLFIVFAGVLGLVFDGARILYERRLAQAAADAGAIGAVQELRRGRDDYAAHVKPAAEYDSGLNGYTTANSTINVHHPPSIGTHAGDTDYVEVIVSRSVPTSFMRIFGPQASLVRARSVSGLKATGDPCVIVLDPDASDSYKHNGTPSLQTDCGVMVNSRAASAMVQSGSGGISASWVGVTGGASGSNISPPAQTGVPPMVDPMASMDPPSYAGMASGNKSGTGNETVYWPGYYSQQISVTSKAAVFMPGMYVLEKGMKITGGTVTGNGVTFYSLNESGNRHIDIGGNATVRLSAPTTGDYKGVLFFVNRQAPDMSPGNKIARGDENSYFEGAIYMPSQHLDFAGNPATAVHWTVIIANTLDISGSAEVQVINKPTTAQAPPAYRTVLWE